MSLSPNAQYAYNRLIELGWQPLAAAGIVGNLMWESTPAVDPSIVEIGGGGGFGIAQWTHPSRVAALHSFAEMWGVDVDRLDLQVAFIDWELRNTHKAFGVALQEAKTLFDATVAAVEYENPENPDPTDATQASHWNDRWTYAQQVILQPIYRETPTFWVDPSAAPRAPYTQLIDDARRISYSGAVPDGILSPYLDWPENDDTLFIISGVRPGWEYSDETWLFSNVSGDPSSDSPATIPRRPSDAPVPEFGMPLQANWTLDPSTSLPQPLVDLPDDLPFLVRGRGVIAPPVGGWGHVLMTSSPMAPLPVPNPLNAGADAPADPIGGLIERQGLGAGPKRLAPSAGKGSGPMELQTGERLYPMKDILALTGWVDATEAAEVVRRGAPATAAWQEVEAAIRGAKDDAFALHEIGDQLGRQARQTAAAGGPQHEVATALAAETAIVDALDRQTDGAWRQGAGGGAPPARNGRGGSSAPRGGAAAADPRTAAPADRRRPPCGRRCPPPDRSRKRCPGGSGRVSRRPARSMEDRGARAGCRRLCPAPACRRRRHRPGRSGQPSGSVRCWRWSVRSIQRRRSR
ncbi:MAG: hypothetical protein KIS96_10985 [Bauldia sp.]|nr:hypothetical protein [Bauldia sp.]